MAGDGRKFSDAEKWRAAHLRYHKHLSMRRISTFMKCDPRTLKRELPSLEEFLAMAQARSEEK